MRLHCFYCIKCKTSSQMLIFTSKNKKIFRGLKWKVEIIFNWKSNFQESILFSYILWIRNFIANLMMFRWHFPRMLRMFHQYFLRENNEKCFHSYRFMCINKSIFKIIEKLEDWLNDLFIYIFAKVKSKGK